VSPLDPRTRGRPEHWAPPTPSTGPTTAPTETGSATVTAEPDEPLGVARTRGKWPSSAQAAALGARSVRGGGAPEIVADGVGAGGPSMARDRGARMARRGRGGTGGEGGSHPGRQAQRARMERGARVPSPVGACGHESVRGAAELILNKRNKIEYKTGIGRETRLKQGPEESGIHGSSGILKFTLG